MDTTAEARSVTSPITRPERSSVGQTEIQVPIHSLIARAIARSIAADRRADWLAANPPVSSPAPAAPVAGYYSVAALENLWVNAGGPGWAASQAASIAECESGGNPQAYNPSGASGLWQILGQVVPGNIFDPLVNAENAVSKFQASGDTFGQWVC